MVVNESWVLLLHVKNKKLAIKLEKIMCRKKKAKFSWNKQRIIFPADTKTSQRRRKNVLILISNTSKIGLKWKSRRTFLRHPQDVFQDTSSRCLPGHVLKMSSRRRPQNVFQETFSRCLTGDVFKTSLRRLKTSSRLFLVNEKGHLETIYELSI